MDHKTENNATPEQDQAQTFGRRDLLKALAATGGAVTAAALLPGKWTKPVIEAGVMPAHAATSGALRINPNSLNVFFAGQPQSTDVDVQGAPDAFEATFDYTDEACQVDGDTLLYAVTSRPETLFDGTPIKNINGATVDSDPCKGSISFPFVTNGSYGSKDSLTVKINAGGRDSNTETAPFPVSDGA